MSIAAINEHLLRAVGVGIALFDTNDLKLSFRNEVFASWFESSDEGAVLTTIFPDLDFAAMRSAIDSEGRYATELKFRKKRRTLVVAQIFTHAEVGDEKLIVLECQNVTRIRELESMIESYSTMVERNTREIEREKAQVEKLLLNVMPKSAYEEYQAFGVVAPQKYESVSVLALDFVDFTQTMEQLSPATFVSELNELYSAFDRIGEQFSCERIRTTGDSYRCIAGMHDPSQDHTAAVANAGIRFIRYLNRRNENAETAWRCRIGLGTGSVVGSVIGAQKYVYDVFGVAIKTALESRSFATPMEVLASSAASDVLKGEIDLVQCNDETAQAEGMHALASV